MKDSDAYEFIGRHCSLKNRTITNSTSFFEKHGWNIFDLEGFQMYIQCKYIGN